MISTTVGTLAYGALSTIILSVCGTILAVALGVATAMAAQSIAPLRWMVAAYVSFFRGTPLLIQILIIFYILPGIGLSTSNFVAGVVALGLNGGAHICEMIRGALTAIAPGQIEAARALAMPRFWIWARIILPQTFVLILPPLMVEFAALLKGSALVSVIGYVELARVGHHLMSTTSYPFTVYAVVAVLYFVICFALGWLTRYMQRTTVAQYAL
jgi:His/Glu/Gln/Arg/opine family amino acid ABC transporter permease subunit